MFVLVLERSMHDVSCHLPCQQGLSANLQTPGKEIHASTQPQVTVDDHEGNSSSIIGAWHRCPLERGPCFYWVYQSFTGLIKFRLCSLGMSSWLLSVGRGPTLHAFCSVLRASTRFSEL